MKRKTNKYSPIQKCRKDTAIFLLLKILHNKKIAVPLQLEKESCLSGRKSHTRNVVYALRRTGGSNPSLSAKLNKRCKQVVYSVCCICGVCLCGLSRIYRSIGHTPFNDYWGRGEVDRSAA